MGAQRITGKALMIEIDGQDYWADLTRCFIGNEEAESDTVTFEDAAQQGGARTWFMEANGVQSTDTAALWGLLWDNPGEEYPYTYAPHGNETPSESQPHFTGQLKVGPAPGLGGDANTEATYEHRFELLAKPVKDTGAAG